MSEVKHPKVVVEQAEPMEAVVSVEDIAVAEVAVEEAADEALDEAAEDVAEEKTEEVAMAEEAGADEVAASDDDAEPAEPTAPTPVIEEAPKPEVTPEAETAEEAAPQPVAEPTPAPVAGAVPRVLNPWLHRQFPGREHAVVGCLAGLAFALVVIYVGIRRALFIAACMAVGTLVGMYFDGDRRLTGAVKELRGKKQ